MKTATKKQLDIIQFSIEYKILIPEDLSPSELEDHIEKLYPQLWEEFLNEKEEKETMEELGKYSHTVIIKNIDYPLLKAQKKSLVEIQSKLEGGDFETIEGILNLTDAITDQIEDSTQEGRIDILIAEAPATLKALTDLVEYLGEDWMNDPMVNKAIDQITKAKGLS